MFRSLWGRFKKNENGAVTVDWVVLCAGVVGMVAGLMTSTQTGIVEFTESLKDFMSNYF